MRCFRKIALLTSLSLNNSMSFITKNELQAIAYLSGITIGAGVLALPYVFAQAGALVGVLELVIVTIIVTLLTLYLAETVLRTKGTYEVTGLAEKYLGKKGKLLLVSVSIFYIYGALLAYSVGLGEALHGIFDIPLTVARFLSFFLLAAVVLFGLKVIAKSELLLTPFIFLIIFLLFFSTYDKIALENYNYSTFQLNALFVPLGPLFFALLGFWCVPDMKRIIKDNKKLKRAIILGITMIAGIYLLFTLLVTGVTGKNTSPLYSIALTQYVNHGIGILVYIFPIFTLSTSFLGLGFTLKEMYQLDYHWKNFFAWLGTFAVPFVLLFFIKGSFIDVISVTGAIASVFVLTILIIMFHKAKKMGDRKPEFELRIPKAVNVVLILFCIAIALQTVWIYGMRLLS